MPITGRSASFSVTPMAYSKVLRWSFASSVHSRAINRLLQNKARIAGEKKFIP